MKKTILAAALLGAMAFTAQAANVTMYGSVDAGFAYKHDKLSVNGEQVGEKENSFKFADGLDGANKIGFKGEEDIGNAKVGFKLENQFTISNGEFKNSDKLFSREARLYVRNACGELSAGRMGGLASAAGSYDLFFGEADAFDGGDNDIPFAFVTSDRYDNSLVYQTPRISGVQGTLMYSFNKAGAQEDKMKDNDRYIGAGLTFKQDDLTLVGVYEGQIRPKDAKDFFYKNGHAFSFGGNYDFGVAKVFAGAQIARHADFHTINHSFNVNTIVNAIDTDPIVAKIKEITPHLETDGIKEVADFGNTVIAEYNEKLKPAGEPDIADLQDDLSNIDETAFHKVFTAFAGDLINASQFNGYAMTLGSQIPFHNNLLTVAGYYGHYKNAAELPYGDKKDVKLNVYGVGARLEHFLSKRTTLAAGAGIGQSKLKHKLFDATDKSNIGQVYVGLHHNF